MQGELEFIPIFKSSLPDPENWLPYLEPAYNISKFSNFGEASHLLEARVSEFFGVKKLNVVTCVNATQALTGAVCTSEQNVFDWTIPSWTFTATAAAMISANKSFYFSDIDEQWRLLPSDRKVNAIDVLPFGDGIDISRLESLCDGEIVIDAAASFDALRFSKIWEVKRRFGLVISFHPTKFPAGPEGAVFISNDEDWCTRFRKWTIFGMDEARESYFPGTNAKMNEFSASVILSSLDTYASDRLSLLDVGRKALVISQLNNFEVNNALKHGWASPYWIVKSEEERIERIEKSFQHSRISSRRWWNRGCHRMSAYSNIRRGDLSMTNLVSSTTVGLPLFASLDDSELERINQALAKC